MANAHELDADLFCFSSLPDIVYKSCCFKSSVVQNYVFWRHS